MTGLKATKRESFYERFFLVAQKLLPRHVLRDLCMQTKKERDKMLNDDDMLTAQEISIVLRPILEDLTNRFGVERAQELYKEAAKRAGIDPELVGLTLEEDKPS